MFNKEDIVCYECGSLITFAKDRGVQILVDGEYRWFCDRCRTAYSLAKRLELKKEKYPVIVRKWHDNIK